MDLEATPSSSEWFAAFPLREIAKAVVAVHESWYALAGLPGFHAGRREPQLTRMLKTHVERVTAPKHGVVGMWAAEPVTNRIDPDTAEIVEERRADIVYGWNDASGGIQVVFEFKKLDRYAKSRRQYLGEDGLGRFVTGIYGGGQPVATMVGMLVHPKSEVVPPLRAALADDRNVEELRLRRAPNGEFLYAPSQLFPTIADFDTEHERPTSLATEHGTIRVAHVFLSLRIATAGGAGRND